MSLLLDALKQAEKAREGGTSPASAATKENNNLIEMDREPTSPDKVTPIPDSPAPTKPLDQTY